MDLAALLENWEPFFTDEQLLSDPELDHGLVNDFIAKCNVATQTSQAPTDRLLAEPSQTPDRLPAEPPQTPTDRLLLESIIETPESYLRTSTPPSAMSSISRFLRVFSPFSPASLKKPKQKTVRVPLAEANASPKPSSPEASDSPDKENQKQSTNTSAKRPLKPPPPQASENQKLGTNTFAKRPLMPPPPQASESPDKEKQKQGANTSPKRLLKPLPPPPQAFKSPDQRQGTTAVTKAAIKKKVHLQNNNEKKDRRRLSGPWKRTRSKARAAGLSS